MPQPAGLTTPPSARGNTSPVNNNTSGNEAPSQSSANNPNVLPPGYPMGDGSDYVRTPHPAHTMMRRFPSQDDFLPCPSPIPMPSGNSGMFMGPMPPHHSSPMFHGPPMRMRGMPAHMQHMMGRQLHPPTYLSPYMTPHHPTAEICGICRKETGVDDNAILCESGCNSFYHGSCVGLTQEAVRFVKNETFAEWVCDNCHVTKKIPPVKLKS
ncbi:unnamed protein product [Didymodactylos carnosus]|nr:unnamed protein product [Didymodactylos carnosus]CAF3750813.1 unnamed protein product [Didymodactylos carnosus]